MIIGKSQSSGLSNCIFSLVKEGVPYFIGILDINSSFLRNVILEVSGELPNIIIASFVRYVDPGIFAGSGDDLSEELNRDA